MKIKNKTSGQIIDVPSEHGNMLLTQGWEEYTVSQQERMVIDEVKIEEVKEAKHRKEEVLVSKDSDIIQKVKRVGRPPNKK